MPSNGKKRVGMSLEAAKQRLERWRRSRRGYGRIPNELWKVAAKAAVEHGVYSTASRLQLDVGRLKQWMEVVRDQEDGAEAAFVELIPAPTREVSECTLEVEAPSGHTLRITLKGEATGHVSELGQLLWRCPQ